MSVRIEADWDFIFDMDTPVEVEVLIDRFKHDFPQAGTIRIVVIQEPTQKFIGDVMNNPDSYTYVFTYHQEILDNNPKARYFMGMSAWVDPDHRYEKKFAVSTIVGGKVDRKFSGYALRHELWRRQAEINIPKEFFLSSNVKLNGADYSKHLVLGDRKEDAFDTHFHIAIENVMIRNCFSEKILDCFQSKTVPIHIGTPNIGDYFNIDGVFECRNISEVIEVCNNLTPDTYEKMMPAIEDNFQRSFKWAKYENSLKRMITEILSQ